MGRKSRKKSNKLPKWMANWKPPTELDTEMATLEFDNVYYTEDERWELDDFIFQYSHCIWHGLGEPPGPTMQVFSTEAMKMADDHELSNGESLKGIMGEKQAELLERIDVLKVLLAAESILRGFENVVLYVRFLYSIIIEADEETGDSKIVDIKEQKRIKDYLHSYWALRKRGIYVHLEMKNLNKNTTNVWNVPEQGKNAPSIYWW